MAKAKAKITQEEREARTKMVANYKPLVENEDDERKMGGNRALTWTDRRQQVDDYTEETASKQFRLRQISEHHLMRKRPYLSILDNIDIEEPSLDPNSDANVIHSHILAILGIQSCEGAFFNSLSQNEQNSVRDFLAENHESKFFYKNIQFLLK